MKYPQYVYIISDGPRVVVCDHERGEALACFASAREAHAFALRNVEGGHKGLFIERISLGEAKRIAKTEGMHVLAMDGRREEFIACKKR